MEPTAEFIHTKSILDKTFCNDLIEWFESTPQTHEQQEGKDFKSISDCRYNEYFLDNFYSKIQKQLNSFSAEYHECYLNNMPWEIVGWKMQKSSPNLIGYTGWHCERWPDKLGEKENNADDNLDTLITPTVMRCKG